MPQPVKISLALNFDDLRQRPDLAIMISEVLTLWSAAEDELAIIFSCSLHSEPAVAAAVLGCTANLGTRLAMIHTALKLGINEALAAQFRKELEPKIKSAARRRAKVAHAIWTIHADYPEDLIRFDGTASPTLESERWNRKDFLELQLAMAELQLALRKFSQTLPEAMLAAATTERPPYWRLVPPDPPPSDDPDQRDHDPEE